jgi:hypothetical protein
MILMETTLFLNKKVTLDFGTVLKCAHPHRYKNDAGEWTTASTTYVDVLIRNEKKSEWSELLAAEEGAKIMISGHGKPLGYTNNEGKQLVGLQIEPHTAEVQTTSKSKEIDEAPF